MTVCPSCAALFLQCPLFKRLASPPHPASFEQHVVIYRFSIKFIYACFPDFPKAYGQSTTDPYNGAIGKKKSSDYQSEQRQFYAAELFVRLTRFGFLSASVLALITVNISM
jgi:hypothetical protein